MYGVFCIDPIGVKEIIAEYQTWDEALAELPENDQYCDYGVEFLGKHYAGRNAEADADYIPRHSTVESIAEFVAEIFADMAEALDITAEFIAEVVTKSNERIRKIAERIHFPKVNAEADVRISPVLAQLSGGFVPIKTCAHACYAYRRT